MNNLQDQRFVAAAQWVLMFALSAYGIWTLLVWIGLWSHWNFLQLRAASVYVLPALLPLAFICLRATRPTHAAPIAPGAGASMPYAAAGVWLGLSLILLAMALGLTANQDAGPFTLQWLLFTAACVVLAIPAAGTAAHHHGPSQAHGYLHHLGFYLAICTLLVIAYLTSTNTDADDTHFLGAAVSLLKLPQQPMFQYDTLFGEYRLPNYIYQYDLGQSWEALAALLASTTHADLLDIYYLWMPLAFVTLIPLPLFLLVREFYPRHAWLGVLFACLFLLGWSTYNYHGGQFFTPRFFQGKSVLVTIGVPAILLATRELVRTLSWAWALILGLLLITAGGLSSSGLYLGSLVAGLGYLAFTPWTKRHWLFAAMLIALASLPNLAMLGDVYLHIQAIGTDALHGSPTAYVNPVPHPDTKNASMYGEFGGGKTLAMVLALTWLAMFYARSLNRPRSTGITRLILVLVVLAYNRPLAELATDLTGIDNVIWRWHWALPIGLVLALAAAGGLTYAGNARSARAPVRQLRYGIATLPTVALLVLWAVNASFLAANYTPQIRAWKIYPAQQQVLDYLRSQPLSGSNILADVRVSQLLPRFVNPARVVAPGELYWSKPYFSANETRQRYRLGTLIDAEQPISPQQQAFLARQMRIRGINLMIYDHTRPAADQLFSVATATGMNCRSLGIWEICKRAP